MGAFSKTILRSFEGKESNDGLKNFIRVRTLLSACDFSSTLICYPPKWVKNKCVSKCLNSSKTNNAMKIFLGGDIFDTWENWLGLKINSYKLIDFTIVYYWTFMVQRAHAVFSVWFFLKNKFFRTYRFHYSIIIYDLYITFLKQRVHADKNLP